MKRISISEAWLPRARSLGIATLALGIMACSEWPVVPSEDTVPEMGGQAPETIVDEDGKTWLRGEKTVYASGPVADVVEADFAREEMEMAVGDMDLATATKALRPIMDFAGYTYTLSDGDAEQLARQVLEAVRNPSMDGEPGEIVAGLGGAPTEDGRVAKVKAIIGSDNRQDFSAAAAYYPWNLHAAMDGGAGRCTAFKLINNYTAVTAAHCVHDGNNFTDRQTLTFAAPSGHYATLPSGCYGRSVPGCWNGKKNKCDYAVIRLRGGGAWCNYDDYNVGYFGYKGVGNCTKSIEGVLSGYPSAHLPAGWTYPALAFHLRGDGFTKCAGIDPNLVFYYNDSTGGQSGTAYWTDLGNNDHRVRGIHIGHRNRVFADRNFARRIDSGLISWLKSNGGS